MAKNTYKQDEILEEPFDIRHLLRASSYIKKYRRGMILAIVLSGIGGAFGYVAPMIIQRALDIAVPDKNMRLLFSLVAALIAIYVVSVIFTTIRSRIMVDVSQNIIYDIRKDLFEHLQELPFQYYDDRPHGKILIRVVNYVNSVSDMLSNGLINIVLEAFNLLFIIIFMFMVDVQMAHNPHKRLRSWRFAYGLRWRSCSQPYLRFSARCNPPYATSISPGLSR